MSDNKQHRTRDLGFDSVRALACLLVVLMHSPMPSSHANSLSLSTISYLTSPCIGLFFMVSGALLLPVRTGMFAFLKHRFIKIVIPLLTWTLIYLILKIYDSESEINIVRSICSIPFTPQGHGVLWFLYTIAGLYLMAPVISPWLEKCDRREIEFALVLWAITLCYPLIKLFAEIQSGPTGILYYFGGYGGYFLLGYYIRRFDTLKHPLIIGFLTFVSLLVPAIIKVTGTMVDFYEMFWYLSIFVVILCIAYYYLAYRIKPNHLVCSISRYSFGIYLSHILIMRSFLWRIPIIENISPYPLQTAVVFIMTVILSFLFCTILARIPKARYIIGIAN